MKLIPALRRRGAELLTNGSLTRSTDLVRRALRGGGHEGHDDALFSLLEYASRNVPAYSSSDPRNLGSFPVLNKSDLLRGGTDFLAKNLDESQCKSVYTSGSTGIPFRAIWDPSKVQHHQGAMVATLEYQGIDPFGARVMTKPWPNDAMTSKVFALLRGELRHSCGASMSPSLKVVEAWMRVNRGAGLIGYSSYIEQLLLGLVDLDFDFGSGNVTSVIGTSEAASPALKKLVPELTGERLRMRYSNVENGVVAVSSDDPDTYRIDGASFHVELLAEDSDSPVKSGQMGRIVLTDLRNKAMPFIRYDTGDLARWASTSEGTEDRSSLADVTGRRLDVIITGAGDPPRTVHPMEIWTATSELRPTRQFQLRQHGIGDFTWVLNADPSEALEADLSRILQERVGGIERVRFQYVTEVPVLASGKRKIFINEIEV